MTLSKKKKGSLKKSLMGKARGYMRGKYQRDRKKNLVHYAQQEASGSLGSAVMQDHFRGAGPVGRSPSLEPWANV